MPFISNRGEQRPEPPAGCGVVGDCDIFTRLGVLTSSGAYRAVVAGHDGLECRCGADVDHQIHYRTTLTPLELQGAVVFQNKQCRNCHALDGIGGTRGPDLTKVGMRLTHDQLIDQVSNGTPGGGNMPAYGKQMNPAEMTALVDFLVSLRPANTEPAQNAGRNSGQTALIHVHQPRCRVFFVAGAALAGGALLAVAAAIYSRGW